MQKRIENLTAPAKLKAYAISSLIGLVSGILVGVFLISLQWVTHERQAHPWFIWGLPLIGLLTPWLYKVFGFGAEKGLKLVLEEIHKPQQVAPFSMAPLIYLTTLLSHLVGASVGREGTALQISAATAERMGTIFRIKIQDRRWILIASLSAGFGAALGAPLAGALFGLEVIIRGHIEKSVLIECFIASMVAWLTTMALAVPHFESPPITIPHLSMTFLFGLTLLGLTLGFFSRAHVWLVHKIESKTKNTSPFLKAFIGGVLLLSLYLYFPLDLYQGLGLETIRSSFFEAPHWGAPLVKFALTIIALTAGFKGGEFIPLVFIGSTTGSLLSAMLNLPLSPLAAIGFVSLFAAAAKTPWTCLILAVEYFGWSIAPAALFVIFLATKIAGTQSIYPGQKKTVK